MERNAVKGAHPATQFQSRGPAEVIGSIICLLFVAGLCTSAKGQGYTVSGNQILDPNGNVYYIHGVARASYEWSRTGDGHFAQADFNNIAGWNANTVRIATNQDYVLIDSSCYDPNYLGRLDDAVAVAYNAGLNVIFDLHWNDAGVAGICSHGQKNMADTRSLTFWQIMADHFLNYHTVFFELYNEPHSISWDCWLSGCDPWVGMQQLYDMVRYEGFTNPVIIGGLNWAYDLSGVPTHRVSGFNIVYATHPYDFPDKQPGDWSRAFGFLTLTDPVVATEFGEFDCSTGYVQPALDYFDAPEGDPSRRMGWTGWAWNSPGSCGFPSIIAEWNGTPSVMGQPEYDHLQGYLQFVVPVPAPLAIKP